MNWLERFRRTRVLVVGDVMLDHYVRGRADRISPESPVPVVEVHSDEYHLGGAGNVAANVAAFAASTTLVGVVGTEPPAGRVTMLAGEAGIETYGLIRDPNRATTVKQRVFVGQHQVARIDREERRPVRDEIEDRIVKAIEQTGPYDAVLVQDYEKGVMTPRIRDACFVGSPVAVDPKRTNFFEYHGATVFKPNWKELGDAFLGKPEPTESWMETAREKVGAKNLVVTLGANGILVKTPTRLFHEFPSDSRSVFDVSGAGDTVLAIYGLALASNVSIEEATVLANLAAGIVVSKPGTAVVDPEELLSEALRPREEPEEALA